MKTSPCPVAEMAQLSSAQVPAPKTGTSPTRPGSFPVMPPRSKSLAAARLPASIRERPLRRCRALPHHRAYLRPASDAARAPPARRRDARRCRNKRLSSKASPCSRQNAIAPSPMSSTFSESLHHGARGDHWIARAWRFRQPRRPRVTRHPSRLASISCVPAEVYRPAPGVEMRIILERHHGLRHGVERGSAVSQHAIAAHQGALQPRPKLGLGLRLSSPRAAASPRRRGWPVKTSCS